MKYNELNELTKRGTDGFPIGYYPVDKNHPQYEMPLHWHREFETIHVIKGTLNVFLDGLEYTLSDGDILTVCCNTLHRAVPQSCIYECVVFDMNMLISQNDTDVFLKPILNGEKTVDVLLSRDDSMLYRAALNVFLSLKSDDAAYKMGVITSLYSFFTELYRSGNVLPSEKHRRPDIHTKLISEVIDWIEDNLTETITLSELSKKAGLNEKYFCKIFKNATGKTPIEYINSLKINLACNLLSDGKTVTEAAFASGFSDLSYFSKVFKKYKSHPPKTWLAKSKIHL